MRENDVCVNYKNFEYKINTVEYELTYAYFDADFGGKSVAIFKGT